MSDTEKQTSSKGKKKSKLVPMIGILVVLAGGGAGAYWMYANKAPEQASSKKREVPPEPGVIDLDPFVVNLADPSGSRFLRTDMKLLTWNEDQAAELKENVVGSVRLRSAILELLSLQFAGPLVTPEGKEELKKAIAERATEAVGEELEVTDVLFVEFVVQ